MSAYKYRFSLFTATYNRAKFLPKLADMIFNQSFTGAYEWVIVSDGSTDNTDDIVHEILERANIPVKFFKNTENKGKHEAWRVAARAFEGQYVVTCDDDDLFSEKMLETYDEHWKILEKSSDYGDFWEIRARCNSEDGHLIGEKLPTPYFDSDYNEVSFKMHKECEFVSCRKIEILRSDAAVPEYFLFEDKCSNFPEGIRWSKAARKYKTRFIPNVLRVLVVGHESLTHTESNNKKSLKKKYNGLVSALYTINEIGDLLWKWRKSKYFLTILHLSYCSIRLREPILRYVKGKKERMLTLLAYVPGALIYLFRN